MTAASFHLPLSGRGSPGGERRRLRPRIVRPARRPCAVTMTGQSIQPAHLSSDGCVVVANDNLSSVLARILPAGHLGVRFGAAAFLSARRRLSGKMFGGGRHVSVSASTPCAHHQMITGNIRDGGKFFQKTGN